MDAFREPQCGSHSPLMEFMMLSLSGVHRPLGARVPGGLHPRPAARHQRWRCHLPLGFPSCTCREVSPSPVSAILALSFPSSSSSLCNTAPVAFLGHVPLSPLCCRQQVSLLAALSCSAQQLSHSCFSWQWVEAGEMDFGSFPQ